MSHRFFGWTALALLWCVVFSSYSYTVTPTETGLEESYSLRATEMFSNPETYIVMISTLIVIVPCLETHKISVRITRPSKSIALITIDGFIPWGRFGRISLASGSSCIREWHAFAISSYPGKDEHFMIAAAVGDWTKALQEDPAPTEMWTRRVKFTGLPVFTNCYQRALIVCTGAGVALPISNILAGANPGKLIS